MLNLKEKKLLFDKNGFIILENLLNNKNSFTLFDRVKSEIIDEYDSNYNIAYEIVC